MLNSLFIPFASEWQNLRFATPTLPLPDAPTHVLALEAVRLLQKELQQSDLALHNFGFDSTQSGFVRGKMFGVLVVKSTQDELGFLQAFSGKLANSNHHIGFVPPVYDALTEGSFLNRGMIELGHINAGIRQLREAMQESNDTTVRATLQTALNQRRSFSQNLHAQFYDAFQFVNHSGQYKSLRQLFAHTKNGNPPAGTGECAAPKLYQYAFLNELQPIALAEFYWGAPISEQSCVHGQLYPPCHDKCRPILSYMLGME